jgi:hypothetical protein
VKNQQSRQPALPLSLSLSPHTIRRTPFRIWEFGNKIHEEDSAPSC